jgi:hypothetical protein
MAKILAAAGLVLGGLAAYRGFSVWNACGYDCAVVAGWAGFTATAAMLLGIFLFGLGATALLNMLVGRGQVNGPQQ